jgi:hypothetical protein
MLTVCVFPTRVDSIIETRQDKINCVIPVDYKLTIITTILTMEEKLSIVIIRSMLDESMNYK